MPKQQFSAMAFKELRGILTGPRFVATFTVCSSLIIVSILLGILDYRAAVTHCELGRQINVTRLEAQADWATSRFDVYRTPDPMQIFVSGIALDLGRYSHANSDNAARLRHSFYADEPLFALFRAMDLTFIVMIVMSLIAVAFTYDAVCGEKESGTLRLVFSHPLSRARYLLAKCTGSWLAIIVPFLLPVLMGLLLLQAFGIPFTPADWGRLALLLVLCVAYLSFFVIFGVLMSTLCQRSSVSFLLSLTIWVVVTFIVPRIGMEAASQLVRVPSMGEIEGQRRAYARDAWKKYRESLPGIFAKFYSERNPSMEEDMAFQDSLQVAVRQSIAAHEKKLLEDRRRAEENQLRLGFSLSRISPAAAFQLGAMRLADTDVQLKMRYEDAITTFGRELDGYFRRKHIDPPGTNRIITTSDGQGYLRVSFPKYQKLDLSDLPPFLPPMWSPGPALRQLAVDTCLLLVFTFLAFAAAWVAFLRYDLR